MNILKARLAALCVSLLSCVHLVECAYDQSFCDKKIPKSAGKPTDKVPKFLSDFSVLTEETFYKVDGDLTGMVSHKKLLYSSANKQAAVSQVTPYDQFLVMLDQKSNDCIYKKNSDVCVSETANCKETYKTVGFGEGQSGKINLGSASERLLYPTNIKKKVKFDLSQASRGIKTIRLGICSYRPETDETVVTLMNLVDLGEYPSMDDTQDILVVATVFTKVPNAMATKQRIDFTDYKPLSDAQLSNGFGLGETRCGVVRSDFTSKKMPAPEGQVSYTSQLLFAQSNTVRAFMVETTSKTYNARAQINSVIMDIPVDNSNEKVSVMTISDYQSRVGYTSSLTEGDCNVTRLRTSDKFPTTFYGNDLTKPAYQGVYINRDIPCDLWHFEAPKDRPNVKSTRIYTATSDWLQSQGKDADAFYPVERVVVGTKVFTEFEQFYNFKYSRGYDVPSALYCFNLSDEISAEVTVAAKGKDGLPPLTQLVDEFKQLIMAITGIVSPLRINHESSIANPSAPENEMNVLFQISGRYTGIDDLNNDIYKDDYVTAEQAIEKLEEYVNGGEDPAENKLSVKIKKGSFTHLEWKNWADNSASGYSSGAMAGVALALLLISLAFGAAAMFGYKRYSDGGLGPLSFDLGKMKETA